MASIYLCGMASNALVKCNIYYICLLAAFSVPSVSNLFTGSTQDLYMRYTAEVVPLHTYCELLYRFKKCKLTIDFSTLLMMN